MYFKYGNYTHAIAEVGFEHSRPAKFDSAGVPYAFTETYKLMGRLHGDTQAEITVAIDALKAAYAIQYQDLVLYDSSGAVSSHALINNNTISGVRVIDGPSFPNSIGAEYSTYRSYEITVQADVPALNQSGGGGSNTVEWSESLTFIGDGGPETVWQQYINQPPQQEQIAAYTTIKAIQEGSSLGFGSYIDFPAPLFPIEVEKRKQRVYRSVTPQFMGNGITKYYPRNWSYFFEFAHPQTGNPTGRPT